MRTIAVVLVGALLGAVGLVLWWPDTEREPTGTLVERPLTAAEAEAVVELQAQMVEKLDAEDGAASIDYLVSQGLERSDAERIVRKASEDAATCFFEALRLEADAQSVPFDAVLDAVEATLLEADGPELGAVADVEAVIDQALPCMLDVLQQAGIPFFFGQTVSEARTQE